MYKRILWNTNNNVTLKREREREKDKKGERRQINGQRERERKRTTYDGAAKWEKALKSVENGGKSNVTQSTISIVRKRLICWNASLARLMNSVFGLETSRKEK